MSAMRGFAKSAALLAASLLGAAPLMAQLPAPANVTATAMKGYILVSWRGVRDATVSYRVLRGPDAVKPGQDLTKPLPADASSYNDALPAMGTVYYTVVAVYPDGSLGASAPVAFPSAATAASAPVAPRPTAPVSGRLTGGTLAMGPTRALSATPVTGTGLWEVTLAWPPVATTVVEPVTYLVRVLKTDPATMPPGTPIGFLNGVPARLGSDGRMFVIDGNADMERPTWYSVVATSTTQGSVTFPWYRRDPPPHRGVDAITGAYWPEGTLSSRHWVGCFTVSDVPSAVKVIGRMSVGTSSPSPLVVLPPNHIVKFDTQTPGFHQLRAYFDAAGALQIQMWPQYSSVGWMGPLVTDTAHVQQVVVTMPQVATPWDLTKCAP